MTETPSSEAGSARTRHASLAESHAVVVGGSMAGMLAARVLADHFDRVTVLERDRLPETPSHRKGLPQARHAHILLERGRQGLERLLPGLTAELQGAGAHLLDTTEDLAQLTPFGWGCRFRSGIPLLSSSRDLIDWAIRKRIAALPNVQIRQGVDVLGPVGIGDGSKVGGVRIRPRPSDSEGAGREETLAGDLVVVAGGRSIRLPDWLVSLGFEPPRETVVNSFLGYATRLYRPTEDRRRDWKCLHVREAPPEDPRGGLILPIEGGRWLVTLAGGDGDYPPTEEAAFLDFAKSLRIPDLHEAIRDAEPLGPISSYRATENRLRHCDRLERWPAGLVALGDTVCAFNPVYGQGMTTASLAAEALDRSLRCSGPARLDCRGFQRELSRTIAAPWLLATSTDYRYRRTEGPTPGRSTRLKHRYVDAVTRLSTRHASVRRRLVEVLHLLRPPSALFGPVVSGRVAWARLTARTGARFPSVLRDQITN